MTTTQNAPIPNTPAQYAEIINQCRSLFLKKTTDYGTSWRIMRLASITDQIFIKAKRIRFNFRHQAHIFLILNNLVKI
jgi:hypothetical protein